MFVECNVKPKVIFKESKVDYDFPYILKPFSKQHSLDYCDAKIGEVKTDKMADTDRITMETIKENGDVDGRQEGQGGDTEEASDELWDIFRKDRFDDDSSMFHGFTDKFFKVIKLLTYGFLFLAPLASVIATRGTLQILTNIIGNEQYYGKESVSQDVVSYFLFFIITIPDALRFLKTLLQVIFGKRQTPTLGHLLTVLIREIGHVIGLFGLLYKVAPSLNPLEFTVVIVTIPAVIGFVHAVAYCGRRRKTEYGWNTRKIVKQLLNLVAMFLLLGLLIGVPVIITQNSTVISSKAEFIGWEIASVVLLSTRWIETYSSRNIGKKGCSIPITENQRLARSSDTRIHSIERKMTDSPKSTPNRESHSEEGGPIHGKTVDEDDSNWTTIKPSTEAVGQEIRCSFDKDSLSSRADQNDDNSENSNSKVKFCEKKSDDIHPTCDDTTTDNNAVAVATSNVKGSNKEPTDQGDNREQTNLKDGGNETKNVEVTSETYIGNKNNGMEENASNDEDNSKGTTSKPSTEVVGQEKSCSFDKDSSPSRADQGDNRERVNLKDGENRINNVEVTSETNIGDENNGMEENASDDEDNSKGTTSKPSTEEVGREKSCSFDKHSSPSRADQGDKRERVNLENGENRINNVEVTSETNIGDENNGMEENASNDEDNSKGTTSKPSTEDVGQEKSCSFDKDSSPSRADQGDNRERVNLKNGENRINNVEVTSETNIGDENNGMEENASNDEDNSKGTTIKPSTEDVGKEKSCSFDKDSSPSRADQGDNREQTNMKDGQNRINNVEVTTETYIGDENNGMEENASNDEDNSKGTTSKPSTEVVGREKSFRFDKDSSSSRAHEKDENDESNWNIDADKCQNSSDEQVADIDLKSNAKNKAEKIKKNISEVQNALKQSHSSDSPSMERVKGLRRPREDTTKKLVDDIKQSRETEKQTKIQAEVKSVRQTSNSKYDEKKSEDVHPPSDGTLIGNTEEDANSNEKGSNEAPVNQGENRKLTYLKDGENEINNVKISSETNIGESYGSSLNDDMETGETETSNENSKDPGQIVSALDLNGTGIRYENCTERNEVIENKPPINHDETFKREDNFHHSRDIKEEKMLHDNDGRRCPRLKKPDEEEYVTDGNEHDHYNKTNQRHYQHSLEGFKSTLPPCNIENNRETEEISVSYGEDILWDGQEKETSKDDQVGIGINLPAAGGPSSPNDPDRDRHRNELIAKDIQIAELKAQTAYLRMTERENKNAIVNTEYEKTELLAQIADLRIRERRNKDAIVNTEYEKNSLRKERDEARRTINTLTMAKDGLIDDITRLEENIRILEERLHTTEEDNVTKDANIDTIRSRNSELQTNCETLRENLTAAKDKCISLEENIRILEERLHTTEEDNVTKDANIAELLAQIADLRIRERRNKDAIVNTEYEKNSLRRERDEARRTISTLTMTKDGLIDDVTGLEENIRILEERLHTTEEDNVTKDANIDTIRSRNSELQTNCETLRENLTAAKNKCISLEANQRRLDEKVQCLEKDLEKQAEENTAKSAEISSLKESCGALKESEIRHRGECDKLRKAYEEEKDKTRFMEDRMNSLSGRVDTLEAETEQKDRMIHRKESARQAANEAMQKSQDENQVLCEQLRDLQSLQVQLEQEKAKNHAATEQLIALRQQLSGMDTMQRNIHIWWEEYRLAMNERTQEKADYETCRRRLQTLESELVYVKEERDSLRETTRVDQIEKDRLNAHKHDLTTKLQNQVGQITNMSEEVRNRREAMDTYRREKENLKDRSFELERILLTAERQIEGLKRDDRDRDILNLRAQLSDVSDPRDGDGDNGGPGHGSGGHGNQGGSTPGETNSGQQGFFPNTQSSTVHHRPQTPSNSVGLRGQQSQGTPTSSIFGISMPTSFTFATPSSSSTPLPQHLSGNQGGPSFFTFGSQNSTA